MAEQVISVRYEALTAAAEARIAAFAGKVRANAAVIGKAGKEISAASKTNAKDLDHLGKAGLIAGGIAAYGLKQAADAAIRFESSFAGVRKTVDGTDAELRSIGQGFRDMSERIPTSVNELNRIGEAAGALGIHKGSVLGFTRVIADLGETTNLVGEEGADQLARLANITEMPQQKFDRLGSTVVDLGNKLAATEAEIVHMGLRIAGAGHQIGLTEAEILGFAGALTSVGIEAQAGGTAISRVMIEIANEVANGGDRLEMFAEVAGMSADRFAQAFRDDGAAAVITFVEGLRRMSDEGGNVFGVLEALELNEIRVRDALLRSAGAGDLMRRSIQIGSRAWEENNALTAEAAKRYATTEAKIEIAHNRINDLAIDIGSVLLPAIGAGAGAVGDLADLVQDLPGPLRTVGTGLVTVASGVGIVGGAAMLAIPRINQNRAAVAALGAQAVTTRSLLSGAASFITGPWGMAVVGGATVISAFASAHGDAKREVADFVQILQAEQGALDSAAVKFVEQELAAKGMLGSLTDAGISVREFADAVRGIPEAQESVASKLERAQGTLGTATDFLAGGISQLRTDARNLGTEYERLTHRVGSGTRAFIDQGVAAERYARAQREVGAGLGELVGRAALAEQSVGRAAGRTKGWSDASGVLSGALRTTATDIGGLAGAADDATDEIADLDKALTELIDGPISADEALIAWKDGLVELAKELREGARTLDMETQAGRDNLGVIIDQVRQLPAVAEGYRRQGLSAQEAARRTAAHVKELRQTAIDAGMSATAVDALLARYNATPEQIITTILANTDPATRALELLRLQLADLSKGIVIPAAVRVSGPTGIGLTAGRAIQSYGKKKLHSGGEITGPKVPGLAPDERLIVAQTGERIVSRRERRAGLLSALPRFHDGGDIGPLDSGAVRRRFSGVSGDTSSSISIRQAIAEVDELTKGWERTTDELDAANRRLELLADRRKAEELRAQAKTTEEIAAANEQLAQSVRAIQDFDRERARNNERAAIAAERERAEAELRVASNRESYVYERASLEDRLTMAEQAMAAERAYTDEWMDAAQRRRQVLDAMYDRQRDLLDIELSLVEARMAGEREFSAAWHAGARERDQVLERIAAAEEARIRDLAGDAQAQEAELLKAVRRRTDLLAQANSRQFQALETLNSLLQRAEDIRESQAERRAKLDKDTAERRAEFARDETEAIKARTESLIGFARLDEHMSMRFGNRVSDITRNIEEQIAALREWRQGLADLRARGLSEDVIAQLGLEDSPEALAQVRMLAKGSESEIAALNDAVSRRNAEASAKVSGESANLYGKLGESLLALRERLNEDLVRLHADFEADMAKSSEELADLGVDHGRSYADALAEGLRSGLPGVEAAARELEVAMRDVAKAERSLDALSPRSQPSSGGSAGSNTRRDTLTKRLSNPNISPEYRKRYEAELASLPRYHDGAAMVPGPEHMAFVAPGERIFSAPDNRELIRAIRAMGQGPLVGQITVQDPTSVDAVLSAATMRRKML